MDLDEWELLQDDGFLDVSDSKKMKNNKTETRTDVFDMDFDYFICSSQNPRLPPNHPVPVGTQLDALVKGDPDREFPKVPSETDQDTVSQVFFKKSKDTEFVDLEIPKEPTKVPSETDQDAASQAIFKKSPVPVRTQLDTPVKGHPEGEATQVVPSDIEFVDKKVLEESSSVPQSLHLFEEETAESSSLDGDMEDDDVAWEEKNRGGGICKWSLNGVGAIFSFSAAAAAVICIIVIGGHQRNKKQNQKPPSSSISTEDDKRSKKVRHSAPKKLNLKAIFAVRGVRIGAPPTGAKISFGGLCNGH